MKCILHNALSFFLYQEAARGQTGSREHGKRRRLVRNEWRPGGRRLSVGRSSPAKSLFWHIPVDARLGKGGCRGENHP